MNIVWIGSPFFSQALLKLGINLTFYNFEEPIILTWQDILKLNQLKEPDIVVIADKSRPPFVIGIEEFPCLTVFYCVDSHIHSWYPYYAQAFDICLLSLQDHQNKFNQLFISPQQVWLSPPFAKDDDFITNKIENPKYDLLFVGTVDANKTPERFIFMNKLKELLPNFHFCRGNYKQLYANAKLILNYCELGDLNFRVFEALGCGTCLLTPMIEHGFNDLFYTEKELLTYDKNYMEQLCDLVDKTLQQPNLYKEIALTGLEKVNKYHRAKHRAETFLHKINSVDQQALINKRLNHSEFIKENYLKFLYLLHAESIEADNLKGIYLKAAKNVIFNSSERVTC